MIRKCVTEFGRIEKASLPPRLLLRLQRFDEQHAGATGAGVFDWTHVRELRAQNQVGVVQVPGLQIEILPKIDDLPDGDAAGTPRSRQALLYMLAVAGDLPVTDRDLASQHLQRMPLIEALIRVFTERLLRELRRGLDHAYVHREENGPRLKGKLLLQPHMLHNAARRDRLYVGFDEFIADTPLNRVLKAACSRLLRMARSSGNQQRLREALLVLADVTDLIIRPHDLDGVQLTRSSQRFEPLLDFARLVLSDSSPTASAGDQHTFSLLFPMHQLFEQFVGRILVRHAETLGLSRQRVHLQAVRHRRPLLRDAVGAGRFWLKPDVLIRGQDGQSGIILDTKWKRLRRDVDDPRNGVAQSDLYQLYAYAHRYGSPTNILLYPRVAGVSPKAYRLDGDQFGRELRVAFLDLNLDLPAERHNLIAQLRQVLQGHESL